MVSIKGKDTYTPMLGDPAIQPAQERPVILQALTVLVILPEEQQIQIVGTANQQNISFINARSFWL